MPPTLSGDTTAAAGAAAAAAASGAPSGTPGTAACADKTGIAARPLAATFDRFLGGIAERWRLADLKRRRDGRALVECAVERVWGASRSVQRESARVERGEGTG